MSTLPPGEPTLKIKSHGEPEKAGLLYPVLGSETFTFDFINMATGGQESFDGGSPESIRSARAKFTTALERLPESVLNAQELGEPVDDADIELIRRRARSLATAVMPEIDRFATMLGDAGIDHVMLGSDHGELRFPWALLDVDGTWLGEVAMFSRTRAMKTMTRTGATDREPEPTNVGYAEDDALPSSRHSGAKGEKEYDVVGARFGTAQIDELPGLSPGPLSGNDEHLFLDWLGRSRSLFHFNAHQEDEDDDGFPSVRLRSGASASSSVLADDLALHSPVVLNVCSSGVGVSGDSKSFAFRLRKSQSPAICSTTGVVTDKFATDFARALYEEAGFVDLNLFKAVRRAQRRLLKETKHPMALFYVFEGDMSQALAR